MKLDLAVAWMMVALAVAGILFYVGRVLRRGRASYDRIERQGGSALLNKDVMAMGYWWFEPLGRACVRVGISANQVSWISFVCGVLAAVCASVGYFGFAALFALLAGLLDIVDGMVARLSGSQDPAGAILDSTLDRYVDFLFTAGLVIYYRDSVLLVALVLLAMLGSFMISYSTAKAEAMQVTPPRGSMKRSERVVYLIGASILTPFSIHYLEADWDFSPALGLPMLLTIGLIAVMANISAVQRMVALAQAVREKTRDAAS